MTHDEYMSMKADPEQVKANLRKLAEYLINMSANDVAHHFRMRSYSVHNNESIDPEEVLQQKIYEKCYCGTVACAVGHVPLALEREFKDLCDTYAALDAYQEAPSWRGISELMFDADCFTPAWSFMFGGDWDSGSTHSYEATAWGAADRIMYWVNNQYDPSELYRVNGKNSECYCVTLGMISPDELDKKIKQLAELEANVVDEDEYIDF